MVGPSLFGALAALLASPIQGSVTVSSARELGAALDGVKPGSRILLAPGVYEGGVHAARVRGKEGKPVVIAAADPKNPPVFRGGAAGLHLSEVEHVELRDLRIEGCSANGVNLDDGGNVKSPSRHVLVKNVHVERIGSRGNEDGIKLSGLTDFRVEGCVVKDWGTGGGSAIDMVGCHRGVIEGCAFSHATPGGTGVQAKGGSSEIAIRRCRFENAGSRAVNIGGSTGREYFRPALTDTRGGNAEARAITVEGNTFVGSDAPIACVGVDGATVRFNTIIRPGNWFLRILQESADPIFVACRQGRFSGNLIAFESLKWSEGGVNIGPGTDAASFEFERNYWYCLDAPARSRPKLPSGEKDGVYGVDPKFRDAVKGDYRTAPSSPATGFGAEALK
jgi:hypothetical protein